MGQQLAARWALSRISSPLPQHCRHSNTHPIFCFIGVRRRARMPPHFGGPLQPQF